MELLTCLFIPFFREEARDELKLEYGIGIAYEYT